MFVCVGHFFHVDFSYIFGRDPKPFPAAIRFTNEMLLGMGGWESLHYQQFQSFCANAFLLLRESVVVLLSMVRLMFEAGIADLSLHQEPTAALLAMYQVICVFV